MNTIRNDLFFREDSVESIINALNDMVRIVANDGTVLMKNKAFTKRFSGSSFGDDTYISFSDTGYIREVIRSGKLQRGTRKINDRIYSLTVSPLQSEDGSIYAAVEIFRDMTLDYNIKQNLLMQNAKMQKDLQLARKLQEALVKSALPKIKGYEVTSGFFPCEAVGGDIYDCTVYGDRMVMYIADVSGHGVMPAMLSVFFSRVVRTACLMGNFVPSEILSYAAKEYAALDISDSVYITAFIAVIDLSDNRVTYSNAGLSVLPVVYGDGKFTELYLPSRPICDWFGEVSYQNGEFTFQNGMRMLIYTDGLDDIHQDPSVKERLFELLGKQDFNSEQFIQEVREELHKNPEDDLTMLLCLKNE